MSDRSRALNIEQVEFLSIILGRIFRETYRRGPCACSGLSCIELGCPHWWNKFLRLPPNVLVRIFLAYQAATHIRLIQCDPLRDLKYYRPLFTSLANRYLEENQSIWTSDCEPRSSTWWQIFLERIKPVDFSRMIHMYLTLES